MGPCRIKRASRRFTDTSFLHLNFLPQALQYTSLMSLGESRQESYSLAAPDSRRRHTLLRNRQHKTQQWDMVHKLDYFQNWPLSLKTQSLPTQAER